MPHASEGSLIRFVDMGRALALHRARYLNRDPAADLDAVAGQFYTRGLEPTDLGTTEAAGHKNHLRL